jgi:hypothetical protein
MEPASEKKDGTHPILAAGNPEGIFFNKTHIPGDKQRVGIYLSVPVIRCVPFV